MSPVACEKLIGVIQELSKVRKLEDIISIIRIAARELISSDGVTFVLRDDNSCFYAEENAIGPLWKGQRFPLESCISGWSMIHRTPVVVPDIYTDPRIPHEAYRPTFVKSLAMVPIREQAPVGAIGSYWARHHVATDEELNIMQALANTTSVAIENVNLYCSMEKQLQELNVANKAKDELLMVVSHELRTPLNAIQGWAQMLLSHELSEQESEQALEIIDRNSKAQGRIIDDLLDTSRIILGRLDLDKKKTNFLEIVKTAVESARLQAQKKNIHLNCTYDMNEAYVYGDHYRLMQVINNLLSNAIKFTPKDGHIEIKVQRSGPNLELIVKDDGDGMDSNFLKTVFSRFRQMDTSTTRKHGGLGLGLAIVKHLVEAHNGHIEAHSEGKGHGCEFHVSLPYLMPQDQHTDQAHA